MKPTKQNNEALILGTIINCINNIRSVSGNKRLNESLNKFSKLYLLSTGLKNLNESENKVPNAVKFPESKNTFAYCKKVKKFLDTFELPLQESIESVNGAQNIIRNFKTEISKIINELEKQDSFDNYTNDILKIKISTGKPLTVYGYNLINNFALMQQLSVKYGITNQNLLAIVYDKHNKELLFVGYNTNSVIKYNLESDEFAYKEFDKQLKFNPTQYLKELKELTGINILFELYVSIQALSLKYTDNLYQDSANTILRKQYEQQISLVK